MKRLAVLIIALLAVSCASAFVIVEHWNVYDDEPFYELVENNVDLDVSEVQSGEIKVVFTIPELAVRESKGPYSQALRNEHIDRAILLPWNTEAGEYAIRMTITDSEGNKRIRHRIIQIE